MAYTVLNIVVSQGNSSTTNTTYTFAASNTTFAIAAQVIQQISKNGGIFDDSNVWYPASSIIKVSAA